MHNGGANLAKARKNVTRVDADLMRIAHAIFAATGEKVGNSEVVERALRLLVATTSPGTDFILTSRDKFARAVADHTADQVAHIVKSRLGLSVEVVKRPDGPPYLVVDTPSDSGDVSGPPVLSVEDINTMLQR